jgi:hypothetical protein
MVYSNPGQKGVSSTRELGWVTGSQGLQVDLIQPHLLLDSEAIKNLQCTWQIEWGRITGPLDKKQN